MIKFFKKYHKWLGVIATLFLLFFSISGIILNHRSSFSSIDIDRNIMPDEDHIKNWNNASVKGSVKLSDNKILLYGNIGVWLTDSTFTKFTDFNNGFPKGIDNRKICKVFITKNNNIYAGTLLGFYSYNNNKWTKIELPNNIEHIVDITETDDKLILLSRSYLLESTDYKNFDVKILPTPQNYDNKVGLFKTLWVIHSGEIWGKIGILLVDLIGLIFIFLSISGIIHFIKPYINKKKTEKKSKFFRLNLKWHNKIGWTTILFLIITTVTGMFLRPPLLIPIVEKKVSKIPLTELDTENAWFDNLRRIIYDKNSERFIFATIEGIYSADKELKTISQFQYQPPLSMMGVNVFEKISKDTILVGSFNGIYKWNIQTQEYYNPIPVITKQTSRRGNPADFLSDNVVTGYSKDFSMGNIIFDMNVGVVKFNGERINIKMPEELKNLPMSLWNMALEIHTARIYKPIFGMAYILVVPIIGLITLFILISGFIVWYKRFRN